MPIPEVFRQEQDFLAGLKKLWYKIKESKPFKKFRASKKLNPYHRGLIEINAETLAEAKKIARRNAILNHKKNVENERKGIKAKKEKVDPQFLFKGTRYYAERDCPVDQEYQEDGLVLRGRGDVSDRIPRNKDGKLDLYAEDPIVISIIPVEGPALIGHVCMQYQDEVVNRLLPSIHTDPLYSKYREYSEYYFVYPSQVGIDPKELKREMHKHNIKYGDKRYDLFTNNCAKNVGKILKNVGVKDLDFYGPDKLGLVFTSPGNNPWGKGIKGWCFKHGVHVHTEEMEKYHEKYNFTDVKERREEMKQVRQRYRDYIQNQIDK